MSASPFGVHGDEKVSLFIDGPSFYGVHKQLNLDIDYNALRKEFETSCRFVRGHYFTALPEGDEFSAIRPLIDFLSFNSWTTVTKPVREHQNDQGQRRVKS